jgi:hypothetical protein
MLWKLSVVFVLMLILGAGALAIYGTYVEPPQRNVEQVLPDSQFPR